MARESEERLRELQGLLEKELGGIHSQKPIAGVLASIQSAFRLTAEMAVGGENSPEGSGISWGDVVRLLHDTIGRVALAEGTYGSNRSDINTIRQSVADLRKDIAGLEAVMCADREHAERRMVKLWERLHDSPNPTWDEVLTHSPSVGALRRLIDHAEECSMADCPEVQTAEAELQAWCSFVSQSPTSLAARRKEEALQADADAAEAQARADTRVEMDDGEA